MTSERFYHKYRAKSKILNYRHVVEVVEVGHK